MIAGLLKSPSNHHACSFIPLSSNDNRSKTADSDFDLFSGCSSSIASSPGDRSMTSTPGERSFYGVAPQFTFPGSLSLFNFDDLQTMSADDKEGYGTDALNLFDAEESNPDWITVTSRILDCQSQRSDMSNCQKLTLLKFPVRLQEKVNIGDFSGLRKLLNKVCTSNCSLQTSAATQETDGPAKLVELFEQLSTVYPDYMLVMRKSMYRRSEGVIVAYLESCGTKLFHDGNEHIFNSLRYGRTSTGNVNNGYRRKAASIEKAGKQFKFRARVRLSLVLTTDHTKIQNIVFASNIFEVIDAPYCRTAKRSR